MNCKKVSINPNNHEFINTDIHKFICRLIVWSSEDRLFSWLASQVIGWRSVSSLWRMDCYCCSVAKLCLTLCNPMDCSRPGLPVLHYLLEFAQTHVHWVGDAIQPSHPLFSSCPQSFPASGSFPVSRPFASGGQSIRVKLWYFSSTELMFFAWQLWNFALGILSLVGIQLARISQMAPI